MVLTCQAPHGVEANFPSALLPGVTSITYEPIHVTLTSTYEDLRASGRAQFFRTKSFVRMPAPIVLLGVIGLVTAFNGNAALAGFWFAFATLPAILLAFGALSAFVWMPNRTWKGLGGIETSTDYTFTNQGFSSSSPAIKLEVAWTLFSRYVIVPNGVLLTYKTKQSYYFSKAEMGDAYPAFLRILAANLPCTAYLDDKLPQPRISLATMDIR